jgi:hypothetical protein
MDITADYIRGLVEGEGCFSFCNVPTRGATGNKLKIPTFIIQMHERDKELIEKIKNFLGVKNKVYILKPYNLDGFKRGKTARLMVRDFGEIRDKIIPFFYNKLVGYKGTQLINWLEKIGHDPDIHPSYKVLYSLYKRGYFESSNR